MLSKSQIKHFAKVGSGQGAPQGETDFSNEGFPFIRAGSLEDLLNGKSENDLPKVNEKVARKYRLKLFQPNTIVFAKSGMSALKGRIYKLNSHCYVVNHLATLELLDNANPDYVVYALRYFSPVKLINDNAYPSLKQSVIEEYEVPFPKDREEQLHIANLLSKAESLIAQRRESIRLLDEFLKSTFLEMFGNGKSNTKGFPITTIEKVSSVIKDGPHISPKYSEIGIPILSSRNIKPGEIVMEELKYVSEEMYHELTKRFKPQRNDVLVTKGGTTGFAKAVDFDFLFCIWVHIAAIRPSKLIVPLYLEHYLNSDYGYYQTQKNTKGAANRDLGLKKLAKIELPLPPIELQTQFAQIVKKTEALKTQYQKSLLELENLYGSLSQKAFRGELMIKEQDLSIAAEPIARYS